MTVDIVPWLQQEPHGQHAGDEAVTKQQQTPDEDLVLGVRSHV